MSWRAANPGEANDVEWAQAALSIGQGLAQVVSGGDIILHVASSAGKRQVDVEGTKLRLQQA